MLAAFAITATAKETVTIIYSWTASDPAANYDRTIVDEANKLQDKYTFVFDAKPGAGGSIAANYVLTTPNTILATSSAFFIRPNFYPTESHDVNNFKEILPKCTAPISVASAKYKSWAEVPTDRPLNIGISGLGTTTHLVATQIISKYPNMQIVPFKSTSEALIATLSSQIDFAVGFIGDSESWTKENDNGKRVYILGLTGANPVKQYPTFISQGFPSTLSIMSSPNQLLIPRTVSNEKFKEWREILFKASKAKSVRDAYAVDYCVPTDTMPDADIQPWYNSLVVRWRKISSTVTLK